jgi:hypothetical protein
MRPAPWLLLMIAQAGYAAPPVSYHVRADAGHERLDVSVCVPGAKAQRRFVPGDENAIKLLGTATRAGGRKLERSDEALVASDWRAGECLDYQVLLGANASEGRRALVRRVGPDWTLDPGLMLWRPQGLETDADAELRFELPESWSVSAPWTAIDTAPHRRFRLGTNSPEYPSWIALGPFGETEVEVGAGRYRLALLGSMDETQSARVRAHVRESALEVTNTFPRAFALAPQVLVVPVGPSREASPFGMSNRGGAYAVVGLVDPTKSDSDYRDSWTFVHEFTHGVHPHLGDGRWISEGIATYYQNVLRARSGRLTEAEAWDELDAGFERGRKDKSDMSLSDLSMRMGRLGHFMRGYWSGTALVMMADIELRTRADQPSSLDAALNAYLACCRAHVEEAEPDAFLAELDRQVGGEVFSALYRRLATQSEFPDLTDAYRKLGLRHATPKVAIDEGDAQAAALRHAIMRKDGGA